MISHLDICGEQDKRTEAGKEGGSNAFSGCSITGWREETDSVEPWDEGGSLGHEVGSVAEEDQHGECVAENEFAKACDEEQNAAEPYTGTCCRNTESTRATPVH